MILYNIHNGPFTNLHLLPSLANAIIVMSWFIKLKKNLSLCKKLKHSPLYISIPAAVRNHYGFLIRRGYIREGGGEREKEGGGEGRERGREREKERRRRRKASCLLIYFSYLQASKVNSNIQ